MKELSWDKVIVCPVCSALVPEVMRSRHDEWHANISTVAIDTAKRVAVLEGLRA